MDPDALTVRARVAFLLVVLCGAAPSGVAPVEPTVHTTLETSTPASGDTLSVAPADVRLAFGGPVEGTGASLTLLDAGGQVWSLTASRAPDDVRLVTAPLPALAAGAYRLKWRVISADGHAVSGDFVFFVGEAGAAMAAPPPSRADAGSSGGGGHAAAGAAAVAAPTVAIRAGADMALLALAGVLLLTGWGRPEPTRPTRMAAGILAVAGPLLAAAYAWLWAGDTLGASPTAAARLDGLLNLTTGRVLVAEVVLSALTAWALLLARRPGLAAGFATLAVLAGAAAGHPVGYTPAVAVPAAGLHALAAAVWMGGLLLLVTERGSAGYGVSARHVSGAALLAVLTLATTGAVQTWLLLGTLPLPASSTYERLLMLKVVGFAALVAFGWHHRARLLPAVDTTAGADRLSHSVRLELALVVLVIVAAAVLSHIPPTS